MKECINCKAILDDDELFCHECGTKQEIEKTEDLAEETQESQGKKCIHCGETIDDDSMFCPYCGKQQNEPSSDAIKEEDKTSEEDKNAQNLKEAPKDEENPVQEPSENTQVEESKTEEDNSRLKKWIYILFAILLLSVIGLYLYRNYMLHIEDTDNSDIENVTKTAEAGKPKSPKGVKLDYEMFLDIFKRLSYGTNKFVFHKPPRSIIDRYGLECYELKEDDAHAYALGSNVKFEGSNLVPTGKNAWIFILFTGEEGNVLSLEIFDSDDYKRFIKQAYEYGLASVAMYSDFENEEFRGDRLFAAIRVPMGKGSIVGIYSEDELITFDVIGPLYIEDNSNRIGLHTEVEHWDFNRDPRFN